MSKFDYRSKYQNFINSGFLPEEAKELRTRTKYALTAPPYMRRLIASRRTTYNNAKRYGWTQKEYNDFIRRKYSKLIDGIYPDGRLNVWAMVRELERQGVERGDMYDSPWKRDVKKGEKKKPKKKVDKAKLPTKRDAIIKKIEQLQKQANKARRDVDRLAIEGEMYRYEKELRAIDKKQGNEGIQDLGEVGEDFKW